MKYALIYGGLAGAIVVSIISATIAMDLPSHATSMWVGYLVMLAALSLLFVGMKRYRDVECGGVIKFGRAFALGLGMATVAALIYTIGWEIYLASAGPGVTDQYMGEYTAGILKDMRAEGATQAAIDAKAAEMRDLTERYRNPLFRMPLTFVEIFPVGLVVALVSAALLRNPRLLPAHSR